MYRSICRFSTTSYIKAKECFPEEDLETFEEGEREKLFPSCSTFKAIQIITSQTLRDDFQPRISDIWNLFTRQTDDRQIKVCSDIPLVSHANDKEANGFQ